MSDDPAQVPEAVGARLVARWMEAHNERDIEGMLATTTEDVEFRPLRLTDGANVYVGHGGLCLWFTELLRDGTGYELHVRQIKGNGSDEVLVTGSLDLPGCSPVAEFYGIFGISGGLIARAHHWISDRRTMEELGLIQPVESRR
jgi:hypothetical protein